MQTYFSQLVTQEQQRAYEVIRQALEQKSVFAEARSDEAPQQVYEAVVMDHPLLALSHPIMNCVYDGRSFAFQYIAVDEEKFYARLDATERKIRETYERRGEHSDFALYQTIYDAISETVKYDHDSYLAYWELEGRSDAGFRFEGFYRRHGDAFSPYGALVKKKAVCNGIAKLFQILCERFSLSCACVQARTLNGKREVSEITDATQCDHLLNVVEVDGRQAFVDVTNGLPTESIPFTRYDYFMVNYDVLKKVMLLRPCDLRIFNCIGPRNLYYERNKLDFTSVGKLSRFLAGYISKFGRGQIRFAFSGTLGDDKLTKLCNDILSAHCPPLKQISGTQCSNGFCNCAIIDRK